MLHLKEFKLRWSVGAEGASGGHGSSLERLDALMRVTIDHPIDEGILPQFNLDILGWL